MHKNNPHAQNPDALRAAAYVQAGSARSNLSYPLYHPHRDKGKGQTLFCGENVVSYCAEEKDGG